MTLSSAGKEAEGAGFLSRLEYKWEAHLDRVNITAGDSRFWRLWTKRLGRKSITVGGMAIFSGYVVSCMGAVALCVAIGSTNPAGPLAVVGVMFPMMMAWLPFGYFFLVILDRSRSRFVRKQQSDTDNIEPVGEDNV
jgi:hypothetical protein